MAINIPIITSFTDKGIQEAEKAFGKFGKTGVLVGAAFAAVSTAVVAGFVKSVAAAAEDQRSQQLLAKQLYNTVTASQKTTKATEDLIGQMELASGVADSQLRGALGNLVRSTGDLTLSQDLLTLSLDISAATGKDLESVSIALGKASMGQMTALQKLGIPLDENIKKTKDFSKIQEALDKQFGGASATAADTFGGQLARLGTVFDNLTESIGYAVLNNGYVKDAIGLLPDAVDKAIKAFGEQGLGGALTVFVDNMGITGAYAKRFGIAVALAYNNMAMDAYYALSLLSLGLVQLIPGFVAAGKEVRDNQIRLGLELDANTYYIKDLGDAMAAEAKQTKINATESERWTQIAESMGNKTKKTTGLIDTLGTTTAKVDPKIKEMADRVKEASDALDKRLNIALDTAKTNLVDAQTAFSDFGKDVSNSLSSAFSFKDAKDSGKETGLSFLQGLNGQASGIANYTDDINTLLTKGLSQESLKAILAAGAESGAAIAHDLVTGAQDDITGPSGVNALVKSVQAMADRVGLNAANSYYAAGVLNAQAYLDGVQATFTYAQTRLAAPNLTIADIKGIGAGFDSGMTAPSVTPITSGRPDTNFGGPGGGGNFTVNVNGGDPNTIVTALQTYVRANGPVPINIRNM